MVPGKNGAAQVIKPGLTCLALIALTMRLSFIKTPFDYMK
jgi:hypothetical protein